MYHFSKLGGLSSKQNPQIMETTSAPGQLQIPTVRIFPLITLNSVLLYLLAYIVLFLITRLLTSVSASAFEIPTVIYYSDTDFLINSREWNRDSVFAVYTASPLVSLFLALILIVLYRETIYFSGISGIFMVWLMILCLGHFAGELIMGAILNRGLGYVMMYWYIMDTGRVTLTVIVGLGFLIVGTMLSRVLLYSATVYFNQLKGYLKLKFAIAQFILPFLISTLILQLCELPKFSFYLFSVRCTLVLLLLPLLSHSSTTQDLYFDDAPRKPPFSSSLAAITLFALLIYRVVFGQGIHIG